MNHKFGFLSVFIEIRLNIKSRFKQLIADLIATLILIVMFRYTLPQFFLRVHDTGDELYVQYVHCHHTICYHNGIVSQIILACN